jgi:excisionase family DNA binding protein
MGEVGTPEVLTVKEVQDRLRMSRNAVYEAIGRGEIPSIKVGRRILVPRKQYERLLAGEGRRP